MHQHAIRSATRAALIGALLVASTGLAPDSSAQSAQPHIPPTREVHHTQPSLRDAERELDRFNRASSGPPVRSLRALSSPSQRDTETGLWITGGRGEIRHDDAAQARALSAMMFLLDTPEAPQRLFQEVIDPAGIAIVNSIVPPRQAERGMRPYAPAYTDVGGIPFTVKGAHRPWQSTYQAQDNTLYEVVEALLRYRALCETRKPGRLRAIDRALIGIGESISVVINHNGALPGNWHYDSTPAWARAWEPPVQMETYATVDAIRVLDLLLDQYAHTLPSDSEHAPRWRAAQAYCLDALYKTRLPNNQWPRFNQRFQHPDAGETWRPAFGTPDGTVIRHHDPDRVMSGYRWIIGDEHNANRIILDTLRKHAR